MQVLCLLHLCHKGAHDDTQLLVLKVTKYTWVLLYFLQACFYLSYPCPFPFLEVFSGLGQPGVVGDVFVHGRELGAGFSESEWKYPREVYQE